MKKLRILTLVAFSSLVFILCRAQNWSPVGIGINGEVAAMAVYNGELYAGGQFTEAGTTYATNIAKWNGTTWSAVGTGIQLYGYVSALFIYNGNLYVGGGFDSAGGIPASNIAMWNGSNWSTVGTGVYGPSYASVLCFTAYNGNLIVGGQFDSAGGKPANNIAEWNGTTWSAVGTGIQSNGYLRALSVYNGNLYVGGGFDSAGGKPASSVAEWNGSTWNALGKGLIYNGYYAGVASLCVYNGNLYVAGNFDTAGNIPAIMIASWNGSIWDSVISSVGSWGLFPTCMMVASNGNLIIGGIFDTINNISVNNVATFNGSSWDSIGSGFVNDTGVEALAEYNGELYASGWISQSGSTPVRQIAKWGIPLGINPISSSPTSLSVYPNPSNGLFTISMKNEEVRMKNIEVFNVLGEQVFTSTLPPPNGGGASSTYTLNLSAEPNGIYFLKVITDNGQTLTQKVSVVR